jgi:hypothetical protein
MRFSKPEPLSTEAERLLALERTLTPESPEFRARAVARARAALHGAGTPVVRLSWRGRASAPLAAALVLGIAALSLAAWRGRPGEERPEPSSAATASSPAPKQAKPSRVTSDSGASPDTSPLPAISASPALEVPAPEGARAQAPRRLSDADAYAAELKLLRQARADVAATRFSAALNSIAEHERRFPAGRLREERDALRVKALAGLGRSEDARAAAERFGARYPRSVLSPGIEAATRRAP